jgi:hypothetical protein
MQVAFYESSQQDATTLNIDVYSAARHSVAQNKRRCEHLAHVASCLAIAGPVFELFTKRLNIVTFPEKNEIATLRKKYAA